jgi:hypothetical protein
MSNTVNLLNGIEYLYPDNTIISQMKRTLHTHPECESAMVDAFSLGQLKSKLWLIENLPEKLGLVWICAGWYGTLASLMFEHARTKFDKIRSFDIDDTCAAIADTMNRPWVMDGWQFKASTIDITSIDYYPLQYITHRSDKSEVELVETPDTIINTSCEHIENFAEWYKNIPRGTKLILQSNNYFDLEEHVNCSWDLDSFDKKTPMGITMFKGSLDLPSYTRFMKIGIK